ncbi:hypothetical protein [Aliamphritea spongicola]|uniref:hypothetical protein n=1 Tax=Aliamphritea spongicola TaxID=707589 RepID=UPI00196A6764|nr:hypothetical protein [Aliamphritea spongicola]MBN3563886.1 hypothetical protein [Aliamphritea spongicola]
MEQQLRHQYLDAMGIVSWLPREQLPGALPTPDWVWEFCSLPEDLQPQTAQPSPAAAGASAAAPKPQNSQQNQQAAQQARAALAASLGDKPAEKAPVPKIQKPDNAEQAVQQVVDKTAVAPVAAPALNKAFDASNIAAPEATAETDADSDVQAPFKLAFVAFGDCLVVDTLPPQSRQGLSMQHQSLLDKILRSVGLQGGQGEVFLLPWPMFASKTLDQGATQARKAVMHKLNKSLAALPVSQVILLGESAAQMIIQRSEPLEQLRGILFSLRSDVKVLASASLSEMMTVPGCKKDVWRDLQPLIQHLQSVTTAQPQAAAQPQAPADNSEG